VASFRTWIVGAVVHGLELSSFGAFPSWVMAMAATLSADGYDAAIPYNWAALSAVPASGAVVTAAQGLAAQIDRTIASLAVQPGDVVDIHLIGASRGGDVVSLAAGLLDWNAPALRDGYLKLTLLDPHPARNDAVAYESSSNGPIGRLVDRAYRAFQGAAADPVLAIPARANRAEVFYQTAPVQDTLSAEDRLLNIWGAVPVGGSTASVVYYDLTRTVPSHLAITDFYLQQVAPALATNAPVPIPIAPVPPPPSGGGPAFTIRAGRRFEFTQLRDLGVSPGDGNRLLASFAGLDRTLARGRQRLARVQFRGLDRQIAQLGRRSLLGFAVATLQPFLQEAAALLLASPAMGGASRPRAR
jgi:hypothetical protein